MLNVNFSDFNGLDGIFMCCIYTFVLEKVIVNLVHEEALDNEIIKMFCPMILTKHEENLQAFFMSKYLND